MFGKIDVYSMHKYQSGGARAREHFSNAIDADTIPPNTLLASTEWKINNSHFVSFRRATNA